MTIYSKGYDPYEEWESLDEIICECPDCGLWYEGDGRFNPCPRCLPDPGDIEFDLTEVE